MERKRRLYQGAGWAGASVDRWAAGHGQEADVIASCLTHPGVPPPVRISEGGALMHQRNPVPLKWRLGLSLRFCVHSFQGRLSWSELEYLHSLAGRHLALFLPPGIFSLPFLYCPSNNKGPRFGWTDTANYHKISIPKHRFLPLLSGKAGHEHDVLGVVFQIVLFCFSNIYPFKQPRYFMLRGHQFCWPGTWLLR